MNLKKAAQKKLKKSGGFTLVEMLIVVAIIAILVVVSIPMVSSSLDKARTATDDANMRAAKAAALIVYMTKGESGTVKYYYDADKGQATKVGTGTSRPTGYNQSKLESKNADAGTYFVEVEINADGNATANWQPVTDSSTTTEGS